MTNIREKKSKKCGGIVSLPKVLNRILPRIARFMMDDLDQLNRLFTQKMEFFLKQRITFSILLINSIIYELLPYIFASTLFTQYIFVHYQTIIEYFLAFMRPIILLTIAFKTKQNKLKTNKRSSHQLSTTRKDLPCHFSKAALKLCKLDLFKDDAIKRRITFFSQVELWLLILS